MQETTMTTEASAVKATPTFSQRRDGILSNPFRRSPIKEIIKKLDKRNVLDAIDDLECALRLFKQKLEEN